MLYFILFSRKVKSFWRIKAMILFDSGLKKVKFKATDSLGPEFDEFFSVLRYFLRQQKK